jgi:hypothetical protein
MRPNWIDIPGESIHSPGMSSPSVAIPNLTLQQVYAVADRVRRGICSTKEFAQYRHGACAIAAVRVWQELDQLDQPASIVVFETKRRLCHCLTQYRDLYIDTTADQFGLPEVIVSPQLFSQQMMSRYKADDGPIKRVDLHQWERIEAYFREWPHWQRPPGIEGSVWDS